MKLTPKQLAEIEKIKNNPDSPVTQAAYARYAGVDRSTINKQVKSGLIILTKNGRVIPRQADIARQIHADENKSTDLSKEMMIARLAEQKAKAILAEIRVQEEQQKLVDFEMIKRAFFNQARLTRNQILALPDRISPQLSTMMTSHEVNLFLRKELEQALETLASEVKKLTDE